MYAMHEERFEKFYKIRTREKLAEGHGVKSEAIDFFEDFFEYAPEIIEYAKGFAYGLLVSDILKDATRSEVLEEQAIKLKLD